MSCSPLVTTQAVEAVQPEHRTLLSAYLRALANAVAPATGKLQWVTAPHVLEPFFAAATRYVFFCVRVLVCVCTAAWWWWR